MQDCNRITHFRRNKEKTIAVNHAETLQAASYEESYFELSEGFIINCSWCTFGEPLLYVIARVLKVKWKREKSNLFCFPWARH